MAKTVTKKGTKQKLLECSAAVFTEKGFANTSVAEICEMAEANIASINYHFRSKDALYREVLDYTKQQAVTLYPEDIQKAHTPEEKLYIIISAIIRRTLSTELKGNFYKLVAKEMAEPTEASKDVISKFINPRKEGMQQLIGEIFGKELSEDQAFRLTYSVISQCLFLGYNEKGRIRHLKKNPINPQDAEEFARHIYRFSLAGIKGYQPETEV